MLSSIVCPNCFLDHQKSSICSCYQQRISSDFHVNHLILNNKKHLVRGNQEISFFSNKVIFWMEESTYERYYVSCDHWYHWNLQYDNNAIFYQQIYNNCQLEDIPLGYGLIYLRKIQRLIKRRIARRKYLQIITNIMKKPEYIDNIYVPESMVDNIITFL